MRQYISFRRLSNAPATLAIAFMIASGIPNVASAQTGAKPTTTPELSKVLVGTWEGMYASDHAPAGAVKLVLAKDSVLKITSFALAMNNEMTPVATHNFAVTTTDISWSQEMMGMTCQTTAILKDGQIKGTMVCGHGSVTFTLDKK